MVEGPGHMAMNEIAANMQLQNGFATTPRSMCWVPIVTDIAPGYDHITAAIGGDHCSGKRCGLPVLCDAGRASSPAGPGRREGGIIASRIAAHAADIAKGRPPRQAAGQRHVRSPSQGGLGRPCLTLLWTRTRPRRYFESTLPADRHTCSMCGKMCAVRTTNLILEGKQVEFCTENKERSGTGYGASASTSRSSRALLEAEAASNGRSQKTGGPSPGPHPG